MTQTTPPASKQIRILIADDHPIVRHGLVAILNAELDMQVVAEVGSGREAIEQYRLHQPDIVILDLRMPDIGGVEAITTIRSEFPNACIIMFTIYNTDEDIYRGLKAGAKAYLLKDTPLQVILEVIRSVCGGQRHISAEFYSKLAARLEQPELTPREFEVLQQMASGNNNREIALALSISESTVKAHVSSLLTKLGVTDRTHAVVAALRRGIIRF
ncbi:response regulator transcription factor [Leptolyngbya sp. FACHB-36]|uniref:response regulator n=1 Tax=Leptolyngbya sp. FACHB-36 TaxID=2692808 RepID=UPI00168109D2|nr:response regulator transcription factor [Leptolyngbya sp. FACHB-36]MBD2018953.1 response regulator transcription factor [Leptolyngbya sp. FACHB-36]